MTKASLFDHLCAEQTLLEAWKLVKTKNAAGGIDGILVSYHKVTLILNTNYTRSPPIINSEHEYH